MTDTDRPRATLVQQHLAAAGLLIAFPGADLHITTCPSGRLNVQVPGREPDQLVLFRRVAHVLRADVITTEVMLNGTRHLIAQGGRLDGIPVHLYAPLGQDQDGADDARVMAQSDADQEARDLGFHDAECRAELENDAMAEAIAAEATR